MQVCVGPGAGPSDDVIVAKVTPSGGDPVCIKRIADAVGTKVGLATGTNNGTVLFDDLDWNKHSQPGFENCAECSCPCETGFDDFDRADSSDLGCEWTKVAGSSEIKDSELRFTTTGRAHFEIPNPDDVGTFFAQTVVTTDKTNTRPPEPENRARVAAKCPARIMLSSSRGFAKNR